MFRHIAKRRPPPKGRVKTAGVQRRKNALPKGRKKAQLASRCRDPLKKENISYIAPKRGKVLWREEIRIVLGKTLIRGKTVYYAGKGRR